MSCWVWPPGGYGKKSNLCQPGNPVTACPALPRWFVASIANCTCPNPKRFVIKIVGIAAKPTPRPAPAPKVVANANCSVPTNTPVRTLIQEVFSCELTKAGVPASQVSAAAKQADGVAWCESRYRNGAIMARDEAERGGVPDVDFVAGVPDSGVPHAMGYANHSGKPLARPFVKYTPTWPRSFMPEDQQVRSRVARMKQIPVPELIEGKKLLFVDDSIVRGTQLRETVDFLYSTGAAEVHMRSACPPIMYPCRYLNFSRGNSAMDLLARRMVQELEGNEGQKHLEEYADSRTERGKCLLHEICAQFGFDSLSYQSLDGLLEAIGLDRDKVCTYCWTGKE